MDTFSLAVLGGLWLAIVLSFAVGSLGIELWQSEALRYRLRNLPTRIRGWKAELYALFGIGCLAELGLTVIRADGEHYSDDDPWLHGVGGTERRHALRLRGFEQIGSMWYSPGCTRLDLGLVSRRVVTNAGVGFIVDAFQNLVELETMNFHAVGTDSTAEAAGDTALGVQVESRVSGTQSEPASNQYRTVGTITATAQRLLREHGLFSASSGGVLLDRSVYALITLENGDSIQSTYTLTLTAGG